MKNNLTRKNIPNEWKYHELGELLDYRQPQPYLVSSEEYRDEYKTPVLTAGKTFILGYTNETHGIYKENLPVIIFDDFTTAHKFVDFPFKAKSSVMKILKAKSNVHIKFIYGWMNIHPYTVGEHKRNYLSEYQYQDILVPPLPEQHRIVAVLETWDKAIEMLTKKIVHKKQMKKGLMQKLLTGEVRLPGFSGEWKMVKLGDVASLRKERFNPKESDKQQNFCIELEHIDQGTGNLLGFTSTTDSASIKTIFYPDDILFGKLRAYLRKYWYANKKGVCSTEIWAIKPNIEKILPAYLYNVVISESFIDVATTTYGTHMPRSDWKIVSAFNFSLPNFEEQEAIASILVTADKEISLLKQKLETIKQQKKFLLNNLVTGAIRTPEDMSTYSK